MHSATCEELNAQRNALPSCMCQAPRAKCSTAPCSATLYIRNRALGRPFVFCVTDAYDLMCTDSTPTLHIYEQAPIHASLFAPRLRMLLRVAFNPIKFEAFVVSLSTSVASECYPLLGRLAPDALSLQLSSWRWQVS